MDIKKELKKLQAPVWKVINSYLPNQEPHDHYLMVQEYPRRLGKYFRPALVLLSAQMYGANRSKCLLTAAAMQVSEDWLLIHDDIEDHSEERRSTKSEYRPTLNSLYGDELAINAGDTLHIIMWKILGDNVRLLGKTATGWSIYDKFSDILLKTTEGQYLELNWIRNNKINLSRAEYFSMIDRKTCYYTVVGPLQLGAILSGVQKSVLYKIQSWGQPFGRSFQIWDDVMNVTVKSDIQGKEFAGDIMEGKRTLILIHLLENCTKSEFNRLTKIYNLPREKKTALHKEYVLDLMHKYQSIDYAKQTAKQYAKEAYEILEQDTNLINQSAKQKILALIEFTVNRSR